VNSDIKGHYLRAKEIVEGNANLIQQVAKALLEQREMDGEALAEVLAVQFDNGKSTTCSHYESEDVRNAL
jgi:ATP-dependent Zn protease